MDVAEMPAEAEAREPTVFGIPSPWSGDENDPIPWTYRWWFLAYRQTMQLRHLVGWHEGRGGRCDWCGHRSGRG